MHWIQYCFFIRRWHSFHSAIVLWILLVKSSSSRHLQIWRAMFWDYGCRIEFLTFFTIYHPYSQNTARQICRWEEDDDSTGRNQKKLKGLQTNDLHLWTKHTAKDLFQVGVNLYHLSSPMWHLVADHTNRIEVVDEKTEDSKLTEMAHLKFRL